MHQGGDMSSPEDPRRRLLESAGQIFAEKGFEGADGPGHLPSRRREHRRGELLLPRQGTSLHRGGEERRVRLAGDAAAADLAGGHAARRRSLRDFIRVMVGRLMNPDKPAWHARLMMRELTEPTSACAEWVEEYVRPHAKVLKDILAEVLPRGRRTSGAT